MLRPMPTVAALSIDDYLAAYSDGHPPEYIDGRLVDRPIPTYPHGKAQVQLAGIFGAARKRYRLFPASEVHLRMPNNRVRIPDFAVFHPEEPAEGIPSIPPVLVVEIVSPDERHGELMRKLEEYREWGIRHIWAVDPALRTLTAYGEQGLQRRAQLEAPEFGVSIAPADLFD